jgi:hypothetical protein
MAIVNNHPIGENLPNLVTLIVVELTPQVPFWYYQGDQIGRKFCHLSHFLGHR